MPFIPSRHKGLAVAGRFGIATAALLNGGRFYQALGQRSCASSVRHSSTRPWKLLVGPWRLASSQLPTRHAILHSANASSGRRAEGGHQGHGCLVTLGKGRSLGVCSLARRMGGGHRQRRHQLGVSLENVMCSVWKEAHGTGSVTLRQVLTCKP